VQNTLRGRVAVITGGGQGIGLASAARLAAAGAAIALIERDQATADHAAATLSNRDVPVVAIGADCTEPDAVIGAFDQVRQSLGPVDILLNNVGQGSRERMTPFVGSDLSTLEFMLSVNLRSCILCSHSVAPEMRERRSGRIINLTSEAAVNGAARTWDYAAAKGGIIGFTRALARELAPFGVCVNAIGPGATRTRAMELIPADLKTQIVAGIPMGRMAEPEEIAGAVAFFAGGESSFVTGQTLLVNGGNWFL
jgi:NAD(P)-dependent dehydrogenase (short-subunit alcohol dehydrogenase family)